MLRRRANHNVIPTTIVFEQMRFISSTDGKFIPASHENPAAPGVLKNVLATKETLRDGKVQMINWALLPSGSAFQAHYHEDMQEVFILVSGSAEMTINGQSQAMTVGDTLIVEPREIHTMRNTGDEDVHYVVLGISSEEGGKTVVVEAS